MYRLMLIILSIFITIYSLSTGLFLILLPKEDWLLWPQQWLQGTPFTDLRIPGILLLTLAGIANTWGVWNLLKEHPKQYDRAMLGGYFLVGWVMLELLLSRELYLIHISALILGAMVVLLAYQQKDKWAV